MKYLIFIFSLLFVQLSIWSQFRPQNGVMKSTGDYTAIVNAHIYVSSSEEITKGSILIKDGEKSVRKSNSKRLTNYRFDGKNGKPAS